MRFAPFSVSLVLAAASLAFAPHADAAEVYKWTDANGVTHYADAPPDGQKYERVKVGAGTTSAVPDPAPAPAAPPEIGAGETPEQAIARYEEVRAKNCEIARANLSLIENSPDAQKDTDGDGVPEPMTPEQRTAEIQRNNDLVARSCAK